jgi:Tol biopolymer transport system component
MVNADGTDPRRLTEGPAFNFQPAVSPDGRTVAFASTRDGNYEIYLMDASGTNQRNFTRSPAKETTPVWFPNGTLGYLQEQRVGSGRNAQVASVILRADPAIGQATPLSPNNLVVTDFAVARDGQMLSLVVSTPGQGGSMTSRVYFFSGAQGGIPSEIPPAAPGEQMFGPSFRK